MLLGLISDIHANIYGLEAALEALRLRGVDAILCAGDLVGYYPYVNETLDMLREYEVECVLGNHDAIVVGRLPAEPAERLKYRVDATEDALAPHHRDWIAQLPLRRRYSWGQATLELCHGSPWFPLTEYIYPDYDQFERFAAHSAAYVILGHTHWPLLRREGNVTIFNPGSCGQPRDWRPGACYGVLSVDDNRCELHHTEYDLSTLLADLKRQRFEPALIEILTRTK